MQCNFRTVNRFAGTDCHIKNVSTRHSDIEDVLKTGYACDPGAPGTEPCNGHLKCQLAADGVNLCVIFVCSGTLCGQRDGVPAALNLCPEDHCCDEIDNPISLQFSLCKV